MALRAPIFFILFFFKGEFFSFINVPAALLQSINTTGGLDASACSQKEDVIQTASKPAAMQTTTHLPNLTNHNTWAGFHSVLVPSNPVHHCTIPRATFSCNSTEQLQVKSSSQVLVQLPEFASFTNLSLHNVWKDPANRNHLDCKQKFYCIHKKQRKLLTTWYHWVLLAKMSVW